MAVFAALGIGCGGGAASAGSVVKVGCVEFRPLTYTDQSGRAAGSAIRLLTDLLDHAGLPWETGACLPGARLVASLRDGTAHVAMLIRHPDVANAVLYGHIPMAYLQLDAYRTQANPPLGGMEGLRGKRVILLRGYGYGGWIDFFKDPANAIRISLADSHEAAFRMLLNGHGEYLVDYAKPAARALGDVQASSLQHETLARLEAYFLVSKKVPDAENLLRRIEDEFAATGARPVE